MVSPYTCEIPLISMISDDFELSPQDERRLNTLKAGDTVGDYWGYIEIQKYIIAQEKAHRRILEINNMPEHEVKQLIQVVNL